MKEKWHTEKQPNTRFAQDFFMSHQLIADMTRQEKLQTMEALWDSLSRDAGELASPAWHADVLAGRRARIEDGHAHYVSLDELKSERGE